MAGPVTKAERATGIEAQAALQKEWDRLRSRSRPKGIKGKGAWDESKVWPKSAVLAGAKRAGKKVQVGRVFDIRVMKNAEQAPELQKYKGRAVLGGDQVRDENH